MAGQPQVLSQRRRRSSLLSADLLELYVSDADVSDAELHRRGLENILKREALKEAADPVLSREDQRLQERQARSVFGPGVVLKSAYEFRDGGPGEQEVVKKVYV